MLINTEIWNLKRNIGFYFLTDRFAAFVDKLKLTTDAAILKSSFQALFVVGVVASQLDFQICDVRDSN